MCNHVLVLNLATADFLTGCYLLILGIQSIRFSGFYCHEDKLWRTSEMCSNPGFLNAIATEASVAFLVSMTSFRYYVIFVLAEEKIEKHIFHIYLGPSAVKLFINKYFVISIKVILEQGNLHT